MGASPASITAANATIAYGMLKGHKITSADAVKAYLQSLLNSLRRLGCDFQKRCGQNPGLTRMVARCSGARSSDQAASQLYGHPEAGAHRERKLEQELLDMGAIKVPEFPSTYTFPSYGHLAILALVVIIRR